MENDCGEVLGEILRKLAPLFEKRSLFRKEFLSSISEISTRISANPPSVEEFAVFCFEIHDWLVKFDSPLRAMLLRVLRLSISSSGSTTFSEQTYIRPVLFFMKNAMHKDTYIGTLYDPYWDVFHLFSCKNFRYFCTNHVLCSLLLISIAHCMSLVDEELHWVIVVCLERGEEYLVERMQALKLIKKFMSIAGQFFIEIFMFWNFCILHLFLTQNGAPCLCRKWPYWWRFYSDWLFCDIGPLICIITPSLPSLVCIAFTLVHIHKRVMRRYSSLSHHIYNMNSELCKEDKCDY